MTYNVFSGTLNPIVNHQSPRLARVGNEACNDEINNEYPQNMSPEPRLWNRLPTHVRRFDLSLDTFYRKLKRISYCSSHQRLATVDLRRRV